MVGEIADRAWGEGWGEFRPYFSSVGDAENVPLPLITYQVVDRVPTPERGELKPVFRSQVVDPVTMQSTRLYGQWFDYYIQFDIWDKSVDSCIDLTQRLEELLLTYAGHFKECGVSEILFHRQLRDDLLHRWDPTLNVQSLQYKVRLETLYVVTSATLQGVDIDVYN
jgi:hypothetical protein